ncbi:UvrD-helicase domain-containing protein [Svornostia abyssi]|uniref:UvrD-helicase domain-containing protein n=1 Tax=Svornostia abyssi TaxID=2898438 RepID=A0ABY5PBF4_9ACTN|nr:UvrD-helicase domain-containing protein [Parviterribacteraceae bacterium J379]
MNRLTLAVAGGRKTQSIVDACQQRDAHKRVLVLTYTLRNQDELRSRLARQTLASGGIEVMGWFTFLLNHWVRPYLKLAFPGRRLTGFLYDGDPGHIAGEARFLDREGRAYRRHLSKLSTEVLSASKGAVLDRLSKIYSAIYVDEVQDLNGFDLVVLEHLMRSPIELHMVGDVRQALLDTNVADQKYKQYRGPQIKRWFDLQEKAGLLSIEHNEQCWRSNQQIMDLADSVFPTDWGFQATKSMNTAPVGHDGVFVVRTTHAAAYYDRFEPLCLRHSRSTARDLELPFHNIGEVKGVGTDHVLIAPTGPSLKFLNGADELTDRSRCSLYVAITRARYSVAFVTDKDVAGLDVWEPAA